MSRLTVVLTMTLFAGVIHAQTQTSVTVYSAAGPGAVDVQVLRHADGNGIPGYGLVHERREISLPAGVSEVRFTEIPELLDPTTVQVRPRAGTDVQVMAQRFQFDLGTTQRLLERYLGQQVEVEQVRGNQSVTARGRLLRVADGVVLQERDGTIRLLRDYASVRLPALDAALVTEPTLVWTLRTERAAKQWFDISYETAGLTWWADYDLSYQEHANGCEARLISWASLVNRSGRNYENAQLRLVAGQVNRAQNDRAGPPMRAVMLESAPQQRFAEQAVSEYHLYRLDRPIDLLDGATQQLPLLAEAQHVTCTKELVYRGSASVPYGNLRNPILDPNYGLEMDAGVLAYLAFKNTEQNGLGIALPAGRVRVTQSAAKDEVPQFVGEDTVGHTPANETVRLALGRAFDLVGERRQVDFSVDGERRILEEQIEIKLRNRKASAVTVNVDEHLSRWRQWQLLEASQDYDKVDAGTVRFAVAVPADGESVVRYRVRYSW